MQRDRAVERALELVDVVERDELPVPVREVWVTGDVALGLDPVDRLDVYLTKGVLLEGDPDPALDRELGVQGVGRTVRASWARANPDAVRANDSGHVAPERCLAAHLLDGEEPVHLEVCNASFEDNVTQRLRGARATGDFETLLDPRGVCLWLEGERSETAVEKLRDGAFAFPTLPDAFEMLGLDAATAERAADAVRTYRDEQSGTTVRGDVV